MQRHHRDRGGRDRDRDRDRHREPPRRRSRSPPDRRDDHDDYYRASRGPNAPRDRRRSRNRDSDRDGDRDREKGRGDRDRARSPDRRLGRDGDRDGRPRRDDSRDRDRDRDRDKDRDRDRDRRDRDRDRGRGPREGTADSSSRRPDDDRSRRQQNTNGTDGARTPQPTPAQSEAEKKAERLRKLQAMKQKHAMKEAKDADATPGSTRELLAKMDQRASDATTPSAPDTPNSAAPAPASAATLSPAPTAPAPAPYQGKFDPKAIARSSKASAGPTQQPGALASIKLGTVGPLSAPAPGKVTGLPGPRKAGILPPNRSIGGFGFQKSSDSTKAASKRIAVDLGEEETTKRRLTKLSENLDDTPYADVDDAGDDNDEVGSPLSAKVGDGDAEAARLLIERRDEHIQKESMAMDVDVPSNETANPDPAPQEPTPMDVDGGLDPLDEFMAGLEEPGAAGGGLGAKKFSSEGVVKKAPEPETYFSDDGDYNFKAGVTDDILAIAAKRKKKDIPKHDYAKMDLNPIRKNFWVEPIELSEMTEEEAIELRLELDGIKVSGKNAPRPVQKWSQCGLTRPILDAVERLGYEKPTPIQMQALPIIMSGRDVIGVAKTGSGKTMAFVIPMLRHIKDQDPVSADDGPIALIMTPTRELCTQIHADCLPFAKTLGLRVVAAYGGAPIKDQIAELKRGAEIVVATPGRMIDLLAANQGRVTNLKRATYLVLDEADRMFDMGFEPQVMKIFNNVRPDRQTILFSATMPRIIDALTKKVLHEPVEITVGGRSVVAPEITQIVEVVADERDKFPRVLELLGNLYAEDDDVRALLFVDRQEKADDLLRELLRRGYGCMSIHGGKDQEDRNSTISDFKKGVCPILVATSIAARGLDVKQLKLVINYDAPNHLEDYVHRAGRTGRAGNTGTAVTFITEDQENCTPGIAKALEQSGQPVPPKLEEMRKAWREKVKSGKAKDASGFGGKGLERLDKEREAARVRERKTHKAEGEEDEDNSAETKAGGEKGESLDKARAAILAAASGIVSRDTPGAAAGGAAADGGGGGQKTPGLGGAGTTSAMAPGAAAALLANAGRGGGALDKATTAINEINARLSRAGQLRQGGSTDNKGPDAGAFHATLEINDFPQKARWAVTNRTNLAKILEATGTSITNKGIYYPLGKEVPAGAEPKLYILIEGDTEVVVGNALALLTRLLKEGTVAAMEAESRAPVSGRYTIT